MPVHNIRQRGIQPADVYIGRAGKGRDGYWGNPIAIGRPCPVCGVIHRENGSTLNCFRRWLWTKMKTDASFTSRLRELHDKDLVCFCKPNPCHGDVLLEAAAYLKGFDNA